MNLVTDPNIIAQLEGAGGQGQGTPVTDPGTIAQLEGTNPSFLPRVGADILGGLAQAGNGLINAPSRISSAIDPDSRQPGYQGIPLYKPNFNYGQALGVNAPNFGDKLLQGAAQYAPYMAIPAEGLLGAATGGATYGLTQSQNPGSGAAIGAATNLGAGLLLKGAGKIAGTLFNSQNAQNSIGNLALDKLAKAAQQGSALSPQETAENVAANYSGANGNPLNIDIGTATNNPVLRGIYGAMKYSPGSGVVKNTNIINRQLAEKAVSSAQGNLDNANAQLNGSINAANNQSASAVKDTTAQFDNSIDNAHFNNALSQTNARAQNSETAQALFDQLTQYNQQQGPYKAAIDNAPSYLNALPEALGDRQNLTQGIKDATTSVFNQNRTTAGQIYAPINSSTLRFDNNGQTNLFPNYASATNELLSNQKNMLNLFDKDTDLGAALKSEMAKAQSMVDNASTYGVTLPEAVSRTQNLGQLQAAANSQERRNEGRLLGQLRDGLVTDVHANLENSGNGGLAQQLLTANDYYKNNVVPFYQNNVVRKAVTSNYVPEGASLPKALHGPNGQSILMQMPQEAQNASLYQLLTGGKGNSSGVSGLDANGIGSAYSKLTVDNKKAIAQYNPQADQYFERLPGNLQQNNMIEAAKAPINAQLGSMQDGLAAQLQKLTGQGQAGIQKLNAQKQAQLGKLTSASQENLGNIMSSGQKNIQNSQAALDAAKNNLYGNPGQRYSIKQGGAHALEGASGLAAAHFLGPWGLPLLPAAFGAGRTAAKALRNPALLQAYINGSRLPISQGPLAQALMRGLPAATTPFAVQKGGQ